MRRIVFACAAFMILASPLAAQQTPDEPVPAQTTPGQTAPTSQPPPATPQSELPPPFVPPPPARLYDNYRSTTHHRPHPRAATRHATVRHSTTRHHRAESRHAAARHHATRERQRPVHASKRTIRQCHGMSYKQIMRHSTCRALMRQDLEANEHRHTHASHQKRSSHRHSSTHRKSRAHRRR